MTYDNREAAENILTAAFLNTIEHERSGAEPKCDPRFEARSATIALQDAGLTDWSVTASSTGDAELDAIGFAMRAMEDLGPEAQDRVLDYLCSRLGTRIGPLAPATHAPIPDDL